MSEIVGLRIRAHEELDDTRMCYWKAGEDWLLYMPGCGVGNLKLHQVAEHDDGTITVTPSIRITGHRDGVPTEVHGCIEKGIWRDA